MGPQLFRAKQDLAAVEASQPRMTAPPNRGTCIHEAGHVTFAIVHGLPIRYATVRRETESLGHVMLSPNWTAGVPAVVRGGLWLAGSVAEQYPSQTMPYLRGTDETMFTRLAAEAHKPDLFRLDALRVAAVTIQERWRAVTEIAAHLQHRIELTKQDIDSIYRRSV